jgi:adenine phosphoribosyltransferase
LIDYPTAGNYSNCIDKAVPHSYSQKINRMDLKTLIRNIPDFPKPGIMFRDITTLLNDAEGLRYTIDTLTEKCQAAGLEPDYIVGMESRGFLFGVPLAYQLNAGFIPVRKPGKLPSAVYTVEYDLEYGTDKLEIHQDAVAAHHKVLIVDDLMATGGTAKATAQLLQNIGCEVVGFAFIIELVDLQGRQKLPLAPVISLVQY